LARLPDRLPGDFRPVRIAIAQQAGATPGNDRKPSGRRHDIIASRLLPLQIATNVES